MIERVV